MSIPSNELRTRFLKFFEQHGHFIEKSAPLIPHDDPTLLFVNAGMVPFKNVFTQKESRPYKKAATSQKCVRAGGKHNDLENVGQTARHHTFFEMLGNFSFGAYFKEEAITMAWEFLVKELKLDTSRLSVSVFAGDDQIPFDQEAYDIWHTKIGLPDAKIKRLGRADNFWQMGDTGPCGPCSEIHYDRSGVKIGFGGDNPDDRNIEIWNLVFMQYEMQANGTLKPLPAPCVDTGMGLERLACVINGLGSNYDTDLLRPLVQKASELSHKPYRATDAESDVAMRVIADHARATAFLIADGLFPSNEGRGYVLRRFMRRAIRYGAHHLELKEVFFHKVCLHVVDIMGEAYPELKEAHGLIEKVVIQEEENFRKTLDRGLLLFAQQVGELKPKEHLRGDIVFKLYETYGFPKDLTEDLAKEKGILIDWKSFDDAKKAHEEKSAQGLGLKAVDDIFLKLKDRVPKTNFTDARELFPCKVVALLLDGQECTSLKAAQAGIIVLDSTSFYGESGGQMGDVGTLSAPGIMIKVKDTKKVLGMHVHMVDVEQGEVKLNQTLKAEVNWPRRQQIRRNHSATHLLHSALRQVLGAHVTQKGSLVAPDRLRFDFSHFEALSKDEISRIEDLVNEWILANEEAKVHAMTLDQAKAHGALALFGEKYESIVRVLDMGSHSTELCGGTHCHRTGDIGSFRIVSEAPLAQGIRRIEAITGQEAVWHSRKADLLLKDLSQKLGTRADDLPERIEQLTASLKEAERAQKTKAAASLKDLADKAVQNPIKANDILLIAEIVPFDDAELLRTYADFIRDRLSKGVVVLGQKISEDKCTLLIAAKACPDLHAGKLIAEIAPEIGGKGGGRPDFAQAGGTKSQGLALALEKVKALITKG